VRGLWFWYLVYPLRVYRYLFAVPITIILGLPEPWRGYCQLAMTSTLAGVAAVGLGLLPRRALGLCLSPALQMAAFLLQRKNWGYQCHPFLAGAHLLMLLGLVTVWAEEATRRRALAWLGLTLVYARCLDELQASPWLTEGARPDVGMRDKVAAYLSTHTKPEDRVFYYGIEPYTLFLAQRRPAVPHLMSFMLNFAPAFASSPPPQGAGPDDAARARIRALQPRVADDACQRLADRPPAAMVFTTSLPNTGPDAVKDVVGLCPALRGLLDTRYRETTTIDRTRIYLRSDGG
jgi:hypothetical protein